MTKLSKAQLAILRRMAEGEIIPSYRRGVRMYTLQVLERQGFICDTKPCWRWKYYTITPVGRAYLEGLK
jgi:hypothetical protein